MRRLRETPARGEVSQGASQSKKARPEAVSEERRVIRQTKMEPSAVSLALGEGHQPPPEPLASGEGEEMPYLSPLLPFDVLSLIGYPKVNRARSPENVVCRGWTFRE